MQKKIFSIILLTFVLFFSVYPIMAQALTFNVPLGKLEGCTISATENNCLGLYLKAWYGFAIGIAGILATAVIMYGGFKYLTSRGDKSAASKGKEYIISAITGLALIFLSYTIISLVNPTLTVIRMPALPSFKDTSGVELSVGSQEGTANAASGPVDKNFKSDFNSTLGSIKQAAPTMPDSNSGVRPTDAGSLHQVGRASDYRQASNPNGGGNAAFDTYMNNLINSPNASLASYPWEGHPVYYVKFPDGTSGRVINEGNIWHIDNGQAGEVFNGRTL